MTRETMTSGTMPRGRARTRRERARRGACAGTVARAVTHPMDTVKARAQVRGLGGGTRRTGWRGLYGGLGASLSGAGGRGVFFRVRERETSVRGVGGASALRGWAQALAGVVYTPMDGWASDQTQGR